MLEVAIATAVLIIGVLALLGVLSLAITGNWNQGDRATRTTEYAQDKMEQLMSLNFNDGCSAAPCTTGTNTAVYPPTTTGGTGLTPGGVPVTPGAPVTGYMDYVSNTGAIQTTATGAAYIRQWSVAANSSVPPTLKTITVMVSAETSPGGGAAAPSTTLVCTMSSIQ